MHKYLSVSGGCVTQKIIEKSRFITTSKHVESEEEAKEFIAGVSAKYSDATHNCYAYICDSLGNNLRFSDDGEPQGTAGMPMLEVLKNNRLCETAVVVTRYFGGIKLGTSGLIAAYRQAARLALEEAGRLECHAMETVEFSFPYIAMNGVMKAVKTSGAQITSQTFDNLCSMTLSIRADDAGRLHSMLADVEGLCFS